MSRSQSEALSYASQPIWKQRAWCALLVLLFCLGIPGFVAAQQLTGTLTGTATDESGAAIPSAQVVLKNEGTGDTRETVSSGKGDFTFSAVPPGSYGVTVSASGFNKWQINNVVMTQADSRKLPNIIMKVGSTSVTMDVISAADAVVPADTGDLSTTFNNHMVTELSLQGRNAGELIKLMPGMAFNNGLSQGSSFTGRVVGTNSGPAGAFAPNGQQPNGALQYLLNGTSLIDTNQGTQVANINQDMTAEVKVLTSGYNAEYAKGPVVFEAFSKSGASQFHGSGYFYARNTVFNSLDSYQKNQGIAKPEDFYYYPGGNVGGPVLIPGTTFNKNHDKLFFWAGYEYMRQQPAGNLRSYFVPTTAMRQGDFNPTSLAALTAAGVNTNLTNAPCPPGNTMASCSGLSFPGGQIPVSAQDPNALALLKLYPQPNADPASHGGNNYLYLDRFPQNRWEQAERVDYSVSDSIKISGFYTHQSEAQTSSQAAWWAPNSALPYPSPFVAQQRSDLVTGNYTHVLSPTLTNEFVANYVRFINPYEQPDPSASDRNAIGFNVKGLYGQTARQIPNILSWGGGLAGFYGQSFGGGFNGGAFGGLKTHGAFYDNVTKVTGAHTMKVGFYWDGTENQQSSSNYLQGTYNFETYGGTTTGNVAADLLTGRAQQYTQPNAIPVQIFRNHQYSVYAQDSWKLTRNWTVNYGFRLDHVGQWFNPSPGNGVAVWDPSTYVNSTNAPANTGLAWTTQNAANRFLVPRSGFKSPLAYFNPRFGSAWDVFGNGKMVLRGGFATYRYQNGIIGGPADTASGAFNYTTGAGLTSLASIQNIVPPSTLGANGGTILAYQLNDSQVPRTYNYNVSISAAAPWHSVFEVSYVGNTSESGIIQGGNSKLNDLNIIPQGAYFRPNPNPNSANFGRVVPVNDPSFNANDYFPLQAYQSIYLVGHGSFANYNAVQASWQKQRGPVLLTVNYTFGKVLGTRDDNSSNGPSSGSAVDGTSLFNNYGVLAYDHTQVFNAAYVWHMPSPIHSNRFLAGAVNGWELSGTTQLQSGAPIQPNTGGNINAQFATGVSNSSYLGTNAIKLQPVLTCDPRSNLQDGQYFNPSCFGVPAPGTNGSLVWPYIRGPRYFNSDLSLYKNFKLGERQSFQFRFQAFNFLNHPLKQFNGDGTNNDLRLNFTSPTPGSGSNSVLTNGYPRYSVGNRLVELAVKYYF